MADKDDVEMMTIAQDLVVTKYKMAAEIVNRVLIKLIDKCQPGVKVIDVCEEGDRLLEEETGKVFKKQKYIKRGVAFPTCVSANNCVCNFSPLKSQPDVFIADGDMIKLNLGAHIDGFIAVVAHTIVVGASKENKVTGKKADVMHAAYYAAEAALRLVKPDVENSVVTEAVKKVSEAYKCTAVEGMLSQQLQQFKIDGAKSIIQNPTESQKKDHWKSEFELHEVYGVDVLVSTGGGKARELDTRTTIYKKRDETYNLKMKASRAFFSEVDKKFGNLPFNLRSFEDEQKAKIGVVECLKHRLIAPYTVLYEKESEYVAHFKFTILLMPSGTHKITSGPIDLDIYETDYQIEDESLMSLLNKSVGPKPTKKKKKKKVDHVAAADTATIGELEEIDSSSSALDE